MRVFVRAPPAPAPEQQWRGDPATGMCWGLQFDWTKPQGLFPAHSNDSVLLLGLRYKAHLTHARSPPLTLPVPARGDGNERRGRRAETEA